MKNFNLFYLLFILTFFSCTEDNDDIITPIKVQATFNFNHDWDGIPVNSSDMEITNYRTSNGEEITIGPRFRYIISDVTFTNSTSGEVIEIDDYNLIDVAEATNLSYTPEVQITAGQYNVSFTYGLKTEKNIDGTYTDLNTASFSVPPMLGGGYHYMQMDGKYMSNSNSLEGFNYHHIRAVDPDATNGPSFPDQENFITVELGTIALTANTAIEVKMNVAQWFKGPNIWDLNILNQALMPNSLAQKMMNENGQNVFSLGEVTQ